MSAPAHVKTAREYLTRAHWYLLGVLGAASFFDGYDSAIVAIALPQIRQSFGLSRPDAYLFLSVIFMGTIPAIFVARKADELGRRRLLLLSIMGYTVFTVLTFFSVNIVMFTSFQFFARLFITAEGVVAATMLAEELPAEARGFGFGFLATLTAIGTGMAAIINGVVFAPLDIDWQWLYLMGVPGLLVITFLRRRLPESRRFVRAKAEGRLAAHWTAILRRPQVKWLVLVCSVAFLASMIHMPTELTLDFLQNDRGYSKTLSSIVVVIAGIPSVLIMAWAGSLSDRFGRKLVGCVLASVGVLAWLAFYLLDYGLAVTLPALTLTIVGFAVSWPLISAYNAELFPTAMRSMAGSWSAFARAFGMSMSFLLGYLIQLGTNSLPVTAAILTAGPALMVVLIVVFFPETKGLELEATSGEHFGVETVPFSDVDIPVPVGLTGVDLAETERSRASS